MSKSNAEPSVTSFTRRQFLQTSAVGMGGLFALSSVSGLVAGCNGGGSGVVPEADVMVRFISNEITEILIGFSEMGQGVNTALPMLVAEELNVDWSTVKVAEGVGSIFDNNVYNTQVTAGSTSVISSWTPAREAGARLREMLRQAAANRFNVSIDQCVAENSVVSVTGTDQSATYFELADAASQLPPPASVTLKSPADWTLIGRPIPRLDTPDKVHGTAEFGIDVEVDGMLLAAVMHCPVIGGTVASIDNTAAMAVAGVRAVVDTGNAAVVVADGYWSAQQGVHALYMESGVTWDYGDNINLDSAGISKRLHSGLRRPGIPVYKKGAKGDANLTLEATYEVPFLAHAALETMNCTADAQNGEIWVPTQAQASVRSHVADELGLTPDQVQVHTTFMGGGFGRRLNVDFVLQAVRASQAVGQPVKLIWSRDQCTRHDYYRPAAVARLRVGINGNNIAWWHHRLVAPPYVPDWLDFEGSSRASVETTILENVDPPVSGAEAVGEDGQEQPPQELTDDELDALEEDLQSIEEEAASTPESIIGTIKEKFASVFIAAEGAVEEASTTEDAKGHVNVIGLVGLPYDFPSERVIYRPRHVNVPLGFWRAVGPSYNIFFIETMMDEVATATGQDPVALRRGLLSAEPDYQFVLDSVADKSNWGSPAAGRSQGVAFFRGFGSVSAQVVEVSVQHGRVRVHKVTCVADCGPVINPDIAASQVVGAIVFGLTAALYDAITMEQGRVFEDNFGNYRLLPIREMPEVEVFFVERKLNGPSQLYPRPGQTKYETDVPDQQIGGLGEVGTPLIAPAVANAIFAATGTRVRTLPIRL